jgi:alkylated DNA repair dioxygenase AlkB
MSSRVAGRVACGAADSSPPSARLRGVIHVDPDAEFERIALDDGSWVDVCRGWLGGADELFAALKQDVAWRTSKLFRYDHWVEERRLGAMWRPGLALPNPALAEVHKSLQRRYHVQFGSFGLIQYRDGADGQAFHRDTDMKWLDDTLICILTLGARRPWHLRPRTSRYDHGEAKGATHDVSPGSGDLLVMGGRAQADWEHSVPYLRTRGPAVGTRISLQWRHTSRQGRPFQGGSYADPATYSRSADSRRR